ncbi:MAG: sterol desaturase family protein [bacterium]|nr:sterol desaturase family protein [bacterium]
MKKVSSIEEKKGKLFKNSFLESLTKANAWLAALVYFLYWLLLLCFHYNFESHSFVEGISIYLFAVLFWTLFEYLAHRFLFHFVTEQPILKRAHFLIHGVHHEFPKDIERLVMPPIPGTLLTLFLLGFFYLIIPSSAFIFTAGFVNGWAIYVYIHYMVHAYKPIKGLKFLWTHHAKHHYQDGSKAYGVSSPIWDQIFGTMP